MIEKHRLNNLHAIRGWAALLVVIAHAKYPFWSGGKEYLEKYPRNTWSVDQYLLFAIDMFTSFASVFVITFFVLSGFFIARSLELKSYNPLFFYGDRIIRIYIPFLGSLLLSFLAVYYAFKLNPDLINIITDRPYNKEIINAFNDLNLSSLFNSFLFLPGEKGPYFGNNNPMWSLYYEGIFYILIPFILLYLKKYWFLFIAVTLHIISILYYPGWLTILSFFMNFMIYFAVGVTLYQISNKKDTRYFLLKNVRKFTNFIILFSIIFLFSSIPFGIIGMKKIGFFLGMIGTVLLICWVLYGRRTKLFKIANSLTINKLSHFLGTISFSIYLIHVPLFVFMYSILNLYTGEIIYYERIYWIPVLIMLPISYIFYLLFEKNSLILLNKYKTKFGKKRS